VIYLHQPYRPIGVTREDYGDTVPNNIFIFEVRVFVQKHHLYLLQYNRFDGVRALLNATRVFADMLQLLENLSSDSLILTQGWAKCGPHAAPGFLLCGPPTAAKEIQCAVL